MSETSTVTPNAAATAPEESAPAAPPANNLPAVSAPTAPTQPTRPPVEFDADDPVSLYMNGGVFEQLQRVAILMSKSGLVPDHLKGKVADCSLVAAQAFRWRMDPFAVAQHTFVLQGKLGYEGKLIAAVVNSHRRIETRLNYAYEGEGQARRVVVTAQIKGEKGERRIEGTVQGWATNNEQWKKSPDQMLAYRGAREWARRHMPEAMIGIQAEEEVRETVSLERGPDGTYGAPAPATLGALTEKLRGESATGPVPAPEASIESRARTTTSRPRRRPSVLVAAADATAAGGEDVQAIAGTADAQQGRFPKAAGARQKRLEE